MCLWQFFKPVNHQANVVERSHQTFKNHFISGLCKTDSEWPVQLWDHLLEQAVITINLLRSYLINATILAYYQFHGHKYDLNAHPMMQPGSKGVIFEDPNNGAAWGERGTYAWYTRQSLNHYRLLHWIVRKTDRIRFSGLFDLLPQRYLLTEFNPD